MTTERTTRALQCLSAMQEGLARWRNSRGEDDGESLQELSRLCDRIVQEACVPLQEVPDESVPPRSVAIATALAVFSQPHISRTLTLGKSRVPASLDWEDEGLVEPPLFVTIERLQEALGLEVWALEDLRDEIDRRVSRVLRQRQAAWWLFHHFGLDESDESSTRVLVRHLFPGLFVAMPDAELALVGSQLYALTDQSLGGEDNLYLSWNSQDDAGARAVGSFRGRYVDETLRGMLGRGVGASGEEVVRLLDHMVALVHRPQAARFLAHDRWRIDGCSAVTGLAAPYPCASWLEGRVWPESIPTESWLFLEGDRIQLGRARAVFDKLALIRTTVMMRQIYGDLISVFSSGAVDHASHPRLLSLYDVGTHMRVVLQPLLEWASDPLTAQHVTRRLKVEPEEATRAMSMVASEWSAQAEQVWWGKPKLPAHATVQANLGLHLVITASSLCRLLTGPLATPTPHRQTMLLFAGHYLASAPLKRLWSAKDGESPVIDPLGRWFWPTWLRLFPQDQELEEDNETWSGSVSLFREK